MSHKNYRRIWERHFGQIPVDEQGRPYEIHHKDGNRDNNDPSNLLCVSIQEHYDIHYQQGDYGACFIMAERMKIDPDEKCRLAKLAASKRDQTGERNPNYGKSTSHYVKEVWENRSEDRKKEIARNVSESRKKNGSAKGEKNPMYGRSAVKENNLKWYNNGKESIYVPEGTQPDGFVKGRGKIKWQN